MYEGIATAVALGVTLSGCSVNRQELPIDDESRGLLQQISTICVGAALRENDVAIQVVPTIIEGQRRITVNAGNTEYTLVASTDVKANPSDVTDVLENGDARLMDWTHTDNNGSSATVVRNHGQGEAAALDVDLAAQGLDSRTIITGMCPPYSSK